MFKVYLSDFERSGRSKKKQMAIKSVVQHRSVKDKPVSCNFIQYFPAKIALYKPTFIYIKELYNHT